MSYIIAKEYSGAKDQRNFVILKRCPGSWGLAAVVKEAEGMIESEEEKGPLTILEELGTVARASVRATRSISLEDRLTPLRTEAEKAADR